ncbi:MAG: hypothetical protein EZS28_000569 [Streblomastix strix]|uniref:Uncharacterized protein n=1 Tax=Streblomastix strix TaxID=222440 RepID=A0A5J4XBM1_9EUKA|nr:MAG: hypothetical protein EZS28_000569 [Streblomastix strix]
MVDNPLARRELRLVRIEVQVIIQKIIQVIAGSYVLALVIALVVLESVAQSEACVVITSPANMPINASNLYEKMD